MVCGDMVDRRRPTSDVGDRGVSPIAISLVAERMRDSSVAFAKDLWNLNRYSYLARHKTKRTVFSSQPNNLYRGFRVTGMMRTMR